MQELKDQEAHFVAAMKEILNPQGRAIFDAIGATNVDELYSALVAFPSLAGTDGFDFPHVTTIAHSVSGKVFANFMEENAQSRCATTTLHPARPRRKPHLAPKQLPTLKSMLSEATFLSLSLLRVL